MSLDALAALARRELAQLNFPAPNWVPPPAGPEGVALLDVLVVGGGMCGQTAAFALLREGVRNLRCVDRAPRGREGPWATFARMDTLRSPKHLTGPDLGIAALTYRAWHEAKYGVEHWEKLHKIPRLDWADYLLWVRDAAGIPVENGVEVVSLELSAGGVKANIRNQTPVYARKVVLALGRDGSGAPRWPRFPSFDAESRDPAGPVFHSVDRIDFRLLKNKSIGILGAGASAFDNAGEALEAGARQVMLFARRPYLPQVNKSKWTAFPGFQNAYASLDDARRWRFYTYIFSEQVPPPYESVQRCERHAGFSVRLGEGWDDLRVADAVNVRTARGTQAFDAVIVAAGFDVNLTDRPEVASFRERIRLWRQHVPASEAARFPEESRFPYLGKGFELVEKAPGVAPGIGRVHAFNWGATMSHGALAGDIPGLEIGARRLASGVAGDLFAEDADLHWARLLAHSEDELGPTRFFVPPEKR